MIPSTKINLKIKTLAKKIGVKFSTAEIFLVGGPVRDLLLNKKVKDYDLLVRGVPTKKLESFLATLGKINLVGKNFGVFKLKLKNTTDEIDIALPRTEYSLNNNGAYRDFKIQSDYKLPIEEDLSRRDFTVNAMAYNLITKETIDPFAGLKDLNKKTLRAVGKPEERFKEDYSRMLRCIRFSLQHDFDIETKTYSALKKLAPKINSKSKGEYIVPRETIGKELLKSFIANPTKALELLDETGYIKQLMPELLKMKGCDQPNNWHTEGDVWLHTVLCLKNLSSKKYKQRFTDTPSINLILGVLFHDLGKPYTIQTPEKDGTDRIRFNNHDYQGGKLAKEICNRLKLSSYKEAGIDCDCDIIEDLVAKHMLTVHGPIEKMKNTTIEKYFFSSFPGDDLIRLLYIDAISTIPAVGRPYIGHLTRLLNRIKKLKKLGSGKKDRLPRPVVNGREIMKATKLEASPRIGKLITKLREEQLKGKIKTKQQALSFIKRIK